MKEMLDFNFTWYKETCAEYKMKADNFMSCLELDQAMMYSREMVFWEDQIKKARAKNTLPQVHWLYSEEAKQIAIEGFKSSRRKANEKRIGHMLNALEDAQRWISYPDGFKRHLEREYRSSGLKLPTFEDLIT